MSKKVTIAFALLACAMLVWFFGFTCGKVASTASTTSNTSSSLSEGNRIAYIQGWAYWFSGYGLNHQGTDYFDCYEYGRFYHSTYDNTYDAFLAGYKEGFYFVNREEPTSLDGANKGYSAYYPN